MRNEMTATELQNMIDLIERVGFDHVVRLIMLDCYQKALAYKGDKDRSREAGIWYNLNVERAETLRKLIDDTTSSTLEQMEQCPGCKTGVLPSVLRPKDQYCPVCVMLLFDEDTPAQGDTQTIVIA